MNTSPILARAQFHILVTAPAVLALFLVAFLFGCESKPPVETKPKPTISLENLQTAYNKAANYKAMYALFAEQAEKERLKVVASLFRAISRSEEIHMNNHAALMRSQGIEPVTPQLTPVTVGSTAQTLKMALSSEDIEVESMYPNIARTADAEKFPEAAAQFTQTQESDARHVELLKEAADKEGKLAKASYSVCPVCGYIVTSEETEECPLCHAAKEELEKI